MKTLKNYLRRVIKDVIKEAISNNQQFLFNSPSIPHSVLNNFTPQKITTAYKQFKLKLDPYSNIRNTDFKFTFFGRRKFYTFNENIFSVFSFLLSMLSYLFSIQ